MNRRPNPWRQISMIVFVMGCIVVGLWIYISDAIDDTDVAMAGEREWQNYTITPRDTQTPQVTETPHPSITPTITPTVPDYEATQQALEATMQAVQDAQATEMERQRQNNLLETQIALQETLIVVSELAKQIAHENDLRRKAESDAAFLAAQDAQQQADYEAELLQENLKAERDKNDIARQEREDDAERKDTFWDAIFFVAFLVIVGIGIATVWGVTRIYRVTVERIQIDSRNKSVAKAQGDRDTRQAEALERYERERDLVTDLVCAIIEANNENAESGVIPRWEDIDMSSGTRQEAVAVLVRHGYTVVQHGKATKLRGGRTVGQLTEEIRKGEFPPITPSLRKHFETHAEQLNTPNSSEHSGTPGNGNFYGNKQGNLRRLP